MHILLTGHEYIRDVSIHHDDKRVTQHCVNVCYTPPYLQCAALTPVYRCVAQVPGDGLGAAPSLPAEGGDAGPAVEGGGRPGPAAVLPQSCLTDSGQLRLP